MINQSVFRSVLVFAMVVVISACLEQDDPPAESGRLHDAIFCSSSGSCGEGQVCVEDFCMPLCEDACEAGECIDGVCVFTPETWDCADDSDCPVGSVCEDGVCIFTSDCVPSAEICNGIDDDCDGDVDEGFDLASDPENCGACGSVCAEGQTCEDGVCIDGSSGICGDRYRDDDEECDDGNDINGDGCENDCTYTPCGCSPEICNGLDDDCDGDIDEDFDLATDPENCGSCGSVCAEGQTCVDGVCEGSDCVAEICNGIDDDCDGDIDEDFDLATDRENCGSCGSVCAEGQICEDGVCTDGGCIPSPEICNGIDDDCDGDIDEGIDLTSDPMNCGSCGSACPVGQTCSDGVCVEGDCIPSPEICNGIDDDCDGDIDEGIDLISDPMNCGGCGMVCAVGMRCEDGACVAE